MMNPTRESAGPMTIEDCVLALMMNGRDRGAVCRNENGAVTGICVLVLSLHAAKVMLPAFEPFLIDLECDGVCDHQLSGVTDAMSVDEILFTVSPRKWGFFITECGRVRITGIVFTGSSVAGAVEICNAHGCPATADPGAIPEGCNCLLGTEVR
jgi:hypothetical protein